MIKTVTLSGAEVKVNGLGGFNTIVHNLSSGTIFASKYPNVSAGADNVAEIPAGAAKLISTTNGTVYLLGTGKAELTGQDHDGVNFRLPSPSGGGDGDEGYVTKGYVDAQDTTNLAKANAYTDSKIGGAEAAAEAAKNTLDEIKERSIVSEEGAFDLRYCDSILQANIDGEWTDIAAGDSGSGISKSYVDSRDALTLTAANKYADAAADKKADKPINAFRLIETVNWQTDDNKDYPYYYDIPVEGAASAERADVFFAADSKENTEKCGFSTEVATSDGFVRIRAKNVPETVLSANVQIGLLSANNTLHIGNDSAASGESVKEHNVDTAAHPDIRAYINELRGRIIALEAAAGGNIMPNPFAVTFGDLDGIIADGIWVPAYAILAF